MQRIGIFSIEEVLPYIYELTGEERREFLGNLVKMGSQRYRLFHHKGTVCTHCGLEGTYFALEKDFFATKYHFNLYGINKEGKEILFTKDHIVPRSKGGGNHLGNYQVLCAKCNRDKGDRWPTEKEVKKLTRKQRKMVRAKKLKERKEQ